MDHTEVDSLLAALLDGPVKYALRAAFEAGVASERSRMLEDDEQASEMRLLLKNLEHWHSETTTNEWYLDPTWGEPTSVKYQEMIAGETVQITVAYRVSHAVGQLLMLTHNHIAKLIRLARIGLDARASANANRADG